METALRKQLESLNGKLRAVSEKARQQRALQQKTQRRQNKKIKEIEDVSFILFVWAAPDATMALSYAAREAAATGLPVEITEVALETRYLNTDVNTLAAISEGSGGMAKGLLATAVRVHKEHDLRHWIQQQNDLKGVAPTTALVLKHLAEMHADKKNKMAHVESETQEGHSTKWAQRFRHRQGLRKGRFAPGERLEQQALQQKVPEQKNRAPHSRAIFGPEPVAGRFQKGGRLAVPF